MIWLILYGCFLHLIGTWSTILYDFPGLWHGGHGNLLSPDRRILLNLVPILNLSRTPTILSFFSLASIWFLGNYLFPYLDHVKSKSLDLLLWMFCKPSNPSTNLKSELQKQPNIYQELTKKYTVLKFLKKHKFPIRCILPSFMKRLHLTNKQTTTTACCHNFNMNQQILLLGRSDMQWLSMYRFGAMRTKR